MDPYEGLGEDFRDPAVGTGVHREIAEKDGQPVPMAADRAARILEGVREHVDTDWLIEAAALRPELPPEVED